MSTKLSDVERNEIRLRYEHGRVTQAQLADDYGVSTATINNIVDRKPDLSGVQKRLTILRQIAPDSIDAVIRELEECVNRHITDAL